MRPPTHPQARSPERSYDFNSSGFRLRLHEWGDPSAFPVLLCHGMWDHAHSFDLLAPLLAERFRLIALDARGHGESAWGDSYEWLHFVGDVVNVLRFLGRAHVLGHSKGGGEATHATCAAPECVDKLINIEGFGPPAVLTPVPGQRERPQPGTPESMRDFLDSRRRLHRRNDWSAYPSIEELARRRQVQNPRLSMPWLRYFCWHGARRATDGFRWKVDPLVSSGAGPWTPQWIRLSWQHLKRPMLAIVGQEQDTWGPPGPELLDERLSLVERVERVTVPGAGHFVHIEQPEVTARLCLDYLLS